MRQDLLPVPYFHVVFAPPHELCLLLLANRAVLLGLLFRAAAATLLQLAADPRWLGAKIGLLMVLHTWGQLMDLHPHLHCVIPGGGLSLDGTRWMSCRDGFFLPVHVIGALFRGKYLAGLKRLWCDGKLNLDGKLSHLADQRQFESWLSTLYAKKWVVYVQSPPSGVAGAKAVSLVKVSGAVRVGRGHFGSAAGISRQRSRDISLEELRARWTQRHDIARWRGVRASLPVARAAAWLRAHPLLRPAVEPASLARVDTLPGVARSRPECVARQGVASCALRRMLVSSPSRG